MNILSNSFILIALACSTPQKQAPTNPVNQPTANEVQNTQQEVTSSTQATIFGDCIQECLYKRQMESRAIQFEADCEQSCDGNATTPIDGSQDILEPQTIEEYNKQSTS